MSEQGLFTEFMREERSLERHLAGRSEVRRLLNEIRGARSTRQLDAIESELEDSIAAVVPKYPELGELQAATVAEGDGDPRWISESTRISTTRFWVKVPVKGDLDLLHYWPDKSDKPLRSVHHDLMQRIGGYANLANASEQDVKEYWRLQPTWQLHLVDRDDGPWGLYTYVDLTADEEESLAASGGLEPVVRDRCRDMREIVDAIVAQAREFFETDLPILARTAVDGRRRVITNRSELLKDLTVPPEWASEPLELEEAVTTGPPVDVRTVDDTDDAEPGAVVADQPVDPSSIERESIRRADTTAAATQDKQMEAGETSLDLFGMSYRLSAKSFSQVLGTIRTWADAVERNPRGFGHMDEDSISDVLAATLNATMPNAGREVFSRNGKVDIHVTANVLAEGSGPAEVFLCEAKFADAEENIRQALEDQIFRYLTARSTQAVLLALCRQQDFNVGESSTRKWAAAVNGFERESEGPVRGLASLLVSGRRAPRRSVHRHRRRPSRNHQVREGEVTEVNR